MTGAVATKPSVTALAPAIVIEGLEFRYGERSVLQHISFEVQAGEIFGILGPNGGGKTTLFKILSTLTPPQGGSISILGSPLRTSGALIREMIGVVFQNPSVDGKLTVVENLRYHGMLYGMSGASLRAKIEAALERLGLADRAGDMVETLSGGLRRRVELAKGLLSDPKLLILDEPSTGLDPGARIDLWRYLRNLQENDKTTILLTTHLMDEADQCDRLAILDQGKIVSVGTPDELRSKIGGDVVTVRARDAEALAERIRQRFGERPARFGDTLRLEKRDGHLFLRQLVETFPDEIVGVSTAKPTLEDVFVHETGHRFWGDA
jgi:ABC-2 type transport system ATP-binding protein